MPKETAVPKEAAVLKEHAALRSHVRDLEVLDGVQGTLAWDEQTHMPPKGASNRGRQQGMLARISHEALVDPRVGTWLSELQDDDPIAAACKRNLGRHHRQALNVPSSLVEELALARSEGFGSWIEAKGKSDFKIFQPKLQRLLDLSLRRAEAIDPNRHPYEIALEAFDPGMTVESLRSTFARLRDGLTPLLDAIATRPVLDGLKGPWPVPAQQALCQDVASGLGYDFAGGRLDYSEHPFSSGLGRGDVRITTHLASDDLLTGLGSTVHETGHALYEQGLPHHLWGTTVTQAASFGLHESQSRFWENFIGRSEPFSNWLAARINKHFPERELSGMSLFQAQNKVERGLIRVQADEVTYNLHVIVRFELELALFEGRLAVADLPEAWNERYEAYLGVVPSDDAEGVLQDVHWSGAAFGYFPSYTLGNLYAASLARELESRQPELWQGVEAGQFTPILAYLRDNIHSKGHLLEAPELVAAVVGDRDHVEDLLAYLWSRHGRLYGLTRPGA